MPTPQPKPILGEPPLGDLAGWTRYLDWLTPPNDPVHPPAYAFFADRALRPDATATGFSRRTASWLADAALLAYGDGGVVGSAFGALEPRMRAATVKGGSTEAYVAHDASHVVVAFRGTQLLKPTARELADLVALDVAHDWLTDGSVRLSVRDGLGVHDGFRRAFDAVWPGHPTGGLRAYLRSLASDAAAPARTFWFTGHSLGGALATLAALAFEREVQPGRGRSTLYTFGSPRVGDRAFHDALTAVLPDAGQRPRAFRVVHESDVVATVPHVAVRADALLPGAIVPSALLSGALHPGALVAHAHLFETLVHVGRRVDVGTDGRIVERATDPDATGVIGEGAFSDLPTARIANHAPAFYASLLWNAYLAGA